MKASEWLARQKTLTLTHWSSHDWLREVLNYEQPRFWSGQERQRPKSKFYLPRSYWGVAEGLGLPFSYRRESGLGPHLYDIDVRRERLHIPELDGQLELPDIDCQMTAYEVAVMRAGHWGYVGRNPDSNRLVAVIFYTLTEGDGLRRVGNDGGSE